jgi:hypothetical protein
MRANSTLIYIRLGTCMRAKPSVAFMLSLP